MADFLDPEGITKTFDYSKYSRKREKWNNKKEFETIRAIRDRFVRMQLGRRTSCPWAAVITETRIASNTGSAVDAGVGTGSNWVDRWNLDYKLWSMWHEYLEGRSNLKSPISFAPIEASMAEFQENNLGITLTPEKECDQLKTRIMQYVLQALDNKSDMSIVNEATFHETLITGSAIRYTGWISRYKDVELILGSDKAEKKVKDAVYSDDEEEIAKVKKRLEEDKKPLTEETEICEYDDIASIPLSIYEFFIDPDARVLRGHAYEAIDCVWRTTPSIEQFRAEFRNSRDSFVLKDNIDKVKGVQTAEQMYQEGRAFFRAPADIAQKDKVELIKYYNKQTDQYIVIANDVLIRKGPLPYNHKQLPFSIHRFIKWPNMFYGVGLPVILESLQAEDETLRNMMLDQLKLTINPPILINSDIYGDIDQGWERIEPGLKIEVSGNVDSSNIRWMEGSQYRPEYAIMRQSIREDAIITSGINPIAYSVPKPGEAVRNNVMSLESTLKMVKKGIKNWAEGTRDDYKQRIALMTQFYSDSMMQEFNPKHEDKELHGLTAKDKLGGVDRANKKERIAKIGSPAKSIRIDGYKLYDDGEGLQEEKINDYSFFELKDEYFDLSGDIDVQIEIDSLLPITRGLKMQKIEQAFAQLVPILSNPAVLNAPGMVQLVREYVETHGLSNKILDQIQSEDSQEEADRAKLQDEAMLRGASIPGVPGESANHKFVHTMDLLDVTVKLNKLMNRPNPNPMEAQPLMKAQHDIMEHLKLDDTPKDKAVGAGMGFASQPAVPQPPMAPNTPPMPQGAGQMPGGAPIMLPNGPVAPSTADVLSGAGMSGMNGVGNNFMQ